MRVPDALVRHISEPLWDLYEGSVRLKTLRALEKSQWFSLGRILENQNRDLADICRHAATTSPFYRERFAAAGIDPDSVRGIGDLRDLPLLTKADIRGHTPRIFSEIFKSGSLIEAKTGGSTGVALKIYCDAKGVEKRAGAALRGDLWSGWRLGQPMAAIWGNPPTPKTLKNRIRAAFKDRIIFLDTMRINDQAIDDFVAAWRRARPGLLYGHAHSIYIFAAELQKRDIRLRPSGIVATSMMLLDNERLVIEDVFGHKVTNRYGCEEVSLISCECEQHAGMHLNSEHNIVEILDERGEPCPPGVDGRIVVTELVNYGMPMIRYEVGDYGVLTDRACPCGRGLPLLASLTGRTADFLVRRDGSRVAGISIIENTLTRFEGIRQLQIVQDDIAHLQVNVVPGRGFDERTEKLLRDSLQTIMGEGLEMDIRRVEAIEQEKNGKYRFTICRINSTPEMT